MSKGRQKSRLVRTLIDSSWAHTARNRVRKAQCQRWSWLRLFSTFEHMHRTSLPRVISMWLLVWFAFFLGEPAQLHLCAVHDGHAQRGAHSSMPGHSVPEHAGHHCTCAGACCSTANVVIPQVAASVDTAVAIDDPAFSPARTASAATAPKHLYPPSIGPPQLRFV